MSKRRDPLPRLNIAPNSNIQQPMGAPGGGFYSPALPTSIQQSFHPSFPTTNPLQTPMQPFFNVQPTRNMHQHQHQASIQLAAAGIRPPNYATPVSGHFPRPSMMLGPGGIPQAPSHPFPNRNRRQLSIGGPPKAVLGGPARKVSPMPLTPGTAPTPSSSTPAPPKAKKIVVNLPKETVLDDDGQPATRPEWARSPSTTQYEDIPVPPAEITSAESYPPDSYRLGLPDQIDVYLPGKIAWDALKKLEIEEKLAKLGVERGTGSNIPHIHAPHARAASISSPADPALLLFKLNKLQKSQDASSVGSSLAASPQPPFAGPFGLSPSPRFLSSRHGHSMSLAQAPSYQVYSSSPSPFNPFGMNAVLGSDSVAESVADSDSSFQVDPIHAPQGRVPFGPPLSAVGGPTHIDFIRGFGLDVPLESEEEGEEEEERVRENDHSGDEEDVEINQFTGNGESDIDDATTTAPQTRMHSRHVSKLSAALSLRSVGGNFQSQFASAAEATEEDKAGEADQSEADVDEEPRPEDPVEEWTGSEDVYLGIETSDDESIGEWSNPSDEERARQQRVERRMRRRARPQNIDQPRRLPDFPRPPNSALGFQQSHDDDIISNPSEENMPLGARRAEFLGVTTEEYYPDGAPLPQPNHFGLAPHSRGPSSQYSAHDPAMAHSRAGSDNYSYAPQHQPSLSTGRGASLNPLAKPFVFGQPAARAAAGSGTWAPEPPVPSMPVPVSVALANGSLSAGGATFSPLHGRVSSLGKSLNVAAPEFKPGAFSFRLPGAPAMPAPEPAAPPFPEPQHAQEPEPSPYKVQGREKRQRRLSDMSVEEEGDSMTSFKFPPQLDTSSPAKHHQHRRSQSMSSTKGPELDHEEQMPQPFTFAGFSAVASNMPWMPKEGDSLDVDNSINNSGTARGDTSEVFPAAPAPTAPSTAPQPRQKRAPIPLDFTHPVSSNTVPAGVFKALISSNNEERRRSTRTRLDSREIFEHSRRPSMDDAHVAAIAQRIPQRSRLVTDPGDRSSTAPEDGDDVFGAANHARRRSSLPDALDGARRGIVTSPSPAQSSVVYDRGAQLAEIEEIVAMVMDEKIGELRREMARREQRTAGSAAAGVEEVLGAFRAQLQDVVRRNGVGAGEDSRMDARGELDFEMIKEILEEGHANLAAGIQQELARYGQRVPGREEDAALDVLPAVEEVGQKTVEAVIEAISELSARQEAASLNAPAVEYDLIVDKIMTALSPLVRSLKQEPVDYAFLTHELTQSVKPHISQLIDLASDKRETAGLIVEHILPHIAALKPATQDTDTISRQLGAEVRRAIAPIDAFEIKEQVADLVVERLDSRLAVRDKAAPGADVIAAKVAESVARLLEPLGGVPAMLAEAQRAADVRAAALADDREKVLAAVAGIGGAVEPQFEQLKTLQGEIMQKLNAPVPAPASDANVLLVKDIVEALSAGQKRLAEQADASASASQDIAARLAALPEGLAGVVKRLEQSLTEVVGAGEGPKREVEELRKLNQEYQVQLAKARGSHGQVRVEKDALVDKLAVVEADRDRARAQVKELQSAASAQDEAANALKARSAEAEAALAKALARVESGDLVAATTSERIADLEAAKRELNAENHELKSKAESLDREVVIARKEKEMASAALAALQAKFDVLVSQQSNWDALSAATEKINLVFNLLENADSEEQKELRHYRDHSKALEEDNENMQKRLKEAEARAAASERASAGMRQTLTQAQQRSEEWERLAKAAQGKAEMLETKLEQAEQTQAQLDADYEFTRMQLDEKEADARLQSDRTTKMQQQIIALESKCTLLQTELEKAHAASRLSSAAPAFRPRANGNGNAATATATPPPTQRPDSRASTVRSERRVSSYTSSTRSGVSTPLGTHEPPSVRDSMHAPPSVRDSMHAPKATNGVRQASWAQTNAAQTPVSRYTPLAPATPKASYPAALPAYGHAQYTRGPSPTPSTVSAVPTQGDDGWWS